MEIGDMKDNSFMKFEVDNIGGYEITLQETTYGNLSQSDISESEFLIIEFNQRHYLLEYWEILLNQ